MDKFKKIGSILGLYIDLPEYDIESLNGWDWLLKPKN